MTFKVYIHDIENDENEDDPTEIIIYYTKEELIKYLKNLAEDAIHVGNDYILFNGGRTTASISGGIFQYLDPSDYR